MTPEERAVIQAAERVVCRWGDDELPGRFEDAMKFLEDAVNAHDRIAEPYWWKDKPPVRISDLAMPDDMPDEEVDAFLDAIEDDGEDEMFWPTLVVTLWVLGIIVGFAAGRFA